MITSISFIQAKKRQSSRCAILITSLLIQTQSLTTFMNLSVPEKYSIGLKATEPFSMMSVRKSFSISYKYLSLTINDSLLKPNGVVEFLEIDPRPRVFTGMKKHKDTKKHTSSPQTDWTDKIVDRFKNPLDEEIATNVPSWTKRVAERLKANMRPQDGVAAACLKSRLQGAG